MSKLDLEEIVLKIKNIIYKEFKDDIVMSETKYVWGPIHDRVAGALDKPRDITLSFKNSPIFTYCRVGETCNDYQESGLSSSVVGTLTDKFVVSLPFAFERGILLNSNGFDDQGSDSIVKVIDKHSRAWSLVTLYLDELEAQRISDERGRAYFFKK